MAVLDEIAKNAIWRGFCRVGLRLRRPYGLGSGPFKLYAITCKNGFLVFGCFFKADAITCQNVFVALARYRSVGYNRTLARDSV